MIEYRSKKIDYRNKRTRKLSSIYIIYRVQLKIRLELFEFINRDSILRIRMQFQN